TGPNTHCGGCHDGFTSVSYQGPSDIAVSHPPTPAAAKHNTIETGSASQLTGAGHGRRGIIALEELDMPHAPAMQWWSSCPTILGGVSYGPHPAGWEKQTPPGGSWDPTGGCESLSYSARRTSWFVRLPSEYASSRTNAR